LTAGRNTSVAVLGFIEIQKNKFVTELMGRKNESVTEEIRTHFHVPKNQTCIHFIR